MAQRGRDERCRWGCVTACHEHHNVGLAEAEVSPRRLGSLVRGIDIGDEQNPGVSLLGTFESLSVGVPGRGHSVMRGQPAAQHLCHFIGPGSGMESDHGDDGRLDGSPPAAAVAHRPQPLGDLGEHRTRRGGVGGQQLIERLAR